MVVKLDAAVRTKTRSLMMIIHRRFDDNGRGTTLISEMQRNGRAHLKEVLRVTSG